VDPHILHQISYASSRAREDARAVLMKGIGIGFTLMLQAYDRGDMDDPKFRQGVSDLVALEREFSDV
jgi:hypothetical protein